MPNDKKTVDFLMGCNSPNGFYSFYDELTVPKKGYRSYLIKGGSGTGKSGLMKKISKAFSPLDDITEHIHCSSDPDSLDGVILHKGKLSVLDATPPHVIEPSCPGGFETVINLCEYFNEEMLEAELEEFVKLSYENSKLHKKCRKHLRCAHILQSDNVQFVSSATDFEKIRKLAYKISKAEFKDLKKEGNERRRLLSAVTNKGNIYYDKTVSTLCDRVYVIKDPYGVSSSYLLKILKEELIKKGYDFFACYCPFEPDQKIEHILIPSLSLGFVTQNANTPFEAINPYKAISFTRFTDKEALKSRKHFLSFNKKMSALMIDAAVEALKEAKKIHDKMELVYTKAVNFELVNKKADEILEKISKRYK